MHPKGFLCRRKFKNTWRAYWPFTGMANRTTYLPKVTWGKLGDPSHYPTFQEPAKPQGGTTAHEFAGIRSCKVSLAHPEVSSKWQRPSIWWGRQTIRKLFPPQQEVFSDAPWGMFSGRWVLQGDLTPQEVSSGSPNSTEGGMCVHLAGSVAASGTA